MEMKKLLESLNECGMEQMPGQDSGAPVSMNISLNASGKEHVADLMAMMKNAGMGGAEEVSSQMMPMRQDMESFRGMVDGDEGPSSPMPAIAPEMDGQDMDEETLTDAWSTEDAQELQTLHGLLMSAVQGDRRAGARFEDYIDNEFQEPSGDPVDGSRLFRKLSKMDQDGQINTLHNLIRDSNRADVDGTDSSMKKGEMGLEGYDNEPDEEYQDTNYMTKDLAGGLNREKKSYKAAQSGDNAMAVETIKAQLLRALNEKKAKPDFLDADKDGDKKEPMKKAIKDKKSKKK
jgi:hypothetical protein